MRSCALQHNGPFQKTAVIGGLIPALLFMLTMCAHIAARHLQLTFHGNKRLCNESVFVCFLLRLQIAATTPNIPKHVPNHIIDSGQWWVEFPVFELMQHRWISFLLKSDSCYLVRASCEDSNLSNLTRKGSRSVVTGVSGDGHRIALPCEVHRISSHTAQTSWFDVSL